MASLREYRQKLKSVKSTQQITKAMKMVAAARLRKAQQRILSARPFADKMEVMLRDLLLQVDDEGAHPLFVHRPGAQRLLVMVTSDKGLCGAYNTNLIREAMRYIKKYGTDQVSLMLVGRKGRDFFRRLGLNIVKDYVGLTKEPNSVQADLLANDILEAYASLPVAAVDLLYNEFKSVIQQRVVVKPFLPLVAVKEAGLPKASDFIYEPVKKVLLEAVVSRSVKSQVLRVLLESAASELGARMSAMDNATRNASELLEFLTLKMNRTRQSAITNEILEVVSGAEALRG